MIKMNVSIYPAAVLIYSYFFIFFGCADNKPEQTVYQNRQIQPLSKNWEKVIPNQEIPEGLESLSASECGDCHEEIYNEWQRSNHALAWQDLQFQAEWVKDDSLWVCINCHTPLQNQQKSIILGKRGGDYFKPVKQTNPHYDPELREESITCAVCHVRDGAVIGTRGDQTEAPHTVKKDPDFLSRTLCLSCHNITDVLTPSLVCSFQTGDEWMAGPYPKAGRDCISCHMPDVYRPLTAEGKARHTRRHTWIGSAIPKFPEGDYIVDGYKSGLDVAVYSSPEKIAAEDSAFLTVSVINQRAGHYIPTGDPEYFLTIDLCIADKNENTLKDTTFKIGQEWEWWPEARKLSDNRLKPLEQRNYTFAVKMSAILENPFWEVIISMNRMTVENATFMGLLGKYPIKAIIYQRKIQLLCSD